LKNGLSIVTNGYCEKNLNPFILDEVLAMDPNDDISQFFEYEENFEILFTMMLDPFQIECSDAVIPISTLLIISPL